MKVEVAVLGFLRLLWALWCPSQFTLGTDVLTSVLVSSAGRVRSRSVLMYLIQSWFPLPQFCTLSTDALT